MNERERDRPSDRKRDRETEIERDREVNEPLTEGGIVGAKTEPPPWAASGVWEGLLGVGVARAPGGYTLPFMSRSTNLCFAFQALAPSAAPSVF